MNGDLRLWLERNHIVFEEIDEYTIDIPDFGRAIIEDFRIAHSILRTDSDGSVKFNSINSPESLIKYGINYIIFPFGDNWFYYDLKEELSFQILKYVGRCNDMSEEFVNLGVHSPYELLNGSFSISDWVRKAKFLGQNAIGICDKNTMGGLLNLQIECKKGGVKPIFGYSLDVQIEEDTIGIKVYCKTSQGINNLLRLQKSINVDSEDKVISFDVFVRYCSGMSVVFDKWSSDTIVQYPHIVNKITSKGCPTYFQIDPVEYKADRIDTKLLNSLKLYVHHLYPQIKPALISDCYYLDEDDSRNKVILNKIADGAAHEQSDRQYFKTSNELWEELHPLFQDQQQAKVLFLDAIKGTNEIADTDNIGFETDRNFMPQYDMTDEEKSTYKDRHDMFLKLLEDGFQKLVPKGQEEVYRKRLDYEIYVLESTNNVDYMLVQYDTVNYARKNNILVGCGRGSAGGCLVLYLLGITLIDPVKYDLIFERFLLPERAGLEPSKTTKIIDNITSKDYIEIELDNGKFIKMDKDALLLVNRHGQDSPIKVYADEIIEGDDIIFDNKDILFTLQ